MNEEQKNNFIIPNWAGKPVSGLHLDVMKEEKLVQKLMIDEKKCYFFGRNKQQCDFQIDHASCSRVHAALLWHKHLSRPFIVDLGSAHGTFIGQVRLEAHKPTQVFIDSKIHFGASTRMFIIRERPPTCNTMLKMPSNSLKAQCSNETNLDNSMSLPEFEADLDNLTEFNTAHNKRIAQLVNISNDIINLAQIIPSVKKKRKNVVFNDDVHILNPEDVDPTVGKFRNLISTTIIIPNKKRHANHTYSNSNVEIKKLRSDSDDVMMSANARSYSYESVVSKLGIKLPDLAPNIEKASESHLNLSEEYQEEFDGLRRKKYAKESWPGKKPT